MIALQLQGLRLGRGRQFTDLELLSSSRRAASSSPHFVPSAVPTPAPHRRLWNRILTLHPPWWGEVWFIVLAAFLWVYPCSSFLPLAPLWWLPVAMLMLALVLAIGRSRRKRALETTVFEIDSGRCIRCEYDLTKLDGSLLCPECGTDNQSRREHALKHLAP